MNPWRPFTTQFVRYWCVLCAFCTFTQVALLATQLLEFIRDGRSVAELMDVGRRLLGSRQVMPGVAAELHEVGNAPLESEGGSARRERNEKAQRLYREESY